MLLDWPNQFKIAMTHKPCPTATADVVSWQPVGCDMIELFFIDAFRPSKHVISIPGILTTQSCFMAQAFGR
jgi:hypothetical protein